MNKEYIDLLHQIEKFEGRVPALREIILQVITRPKRERVPMLKIILGYLKRYPGMKITGFEVKGRENIYAVNGKKIPFASKLFLKAKYKCQDCGKVTEQVSNPCELDELYPWDVSRLIGKKETETHLTCADCLYEYYEPEYERDDPEEPEGMIWNTKGRHKIKS